MRKRLCAALILLMITTACSNGGNGGTAERSNGPAGEGRTVVTLSIRQSDAFYEALERAFEAKYPAIDLRIRAYRQAGEEAKGTDFEQYKKTANTELLAGKGADIYEVSSLPLDEYADKGLLLNMDEAIAQDETLDRSDLEQNVLDTLKYGSGTYAVPSGFSLRAFVGDGEAIEHADFDDSRWNWNDFAETVKELRRAAEASGGERRYALANNPPEVLLQEMVVDRYAAFVDPAAKKAMFDSPSFTDMLEEIKAMYEEGVMTAEWSENERPLFHSTVLRSPEDLVNDLYSLFDRPRLLQKPHEEQSGGMRIIPMSQFAIRSQSPVREEAWKVVSFLLSEEGQSLPEREGFSLLQSVNDKRLDELRGQVASGAYKLPDGQRADVPDEQFEAFKQLIHSADHYAPAEGQVISIVAEEALPFFGGQKSAEETAKLIQNRVTTYLNE